MEDANSMKKLIHSTVFGAMAIIIALMIIKSVRPGNFRNNTSKWAVQSYENSNLISVDMIDTLKGNTLIVDMNSQKAAFNKNLNVLQVSSDLLLSNENYKKIKSNKGSVILSGDPAETAQIWMVLSQMGIEDLYILADHN